MQEQEEYDNLVSNENFPDERLYQGQGSPEPFLMPCDFDMAFTEESANFGRGEAEDKAIFGQYLEQEFQVTNKPRHTQSCLLLLYCLMLNLTG